jgi:lysophospholipase L1-like esterase
MIRRLLGPAIVLAVLLGLGVPTAFADTDDPFYYLALGDSLAVGYQPGSSFNPADGYVPQVYSVLAAKVPNSQLVNLGCGGATTTTLLSGGGACTYTEGSQLAAAEKFLRDHRGHVLLVTIDIGGNDINSCATPNAIDVACAKAAIGTVAANLRKIMLRLRLAAPLVRMVGMTYYDPYLAAWLSGTDGQALAKLSVELTTLLNRTLTDVYTARRARVADVAGAFGTPTDPTKLTGSYPAPVANICALTWMCSRGDIHPNSDGYARIAQAFLAKLPVLSADALVG